MALKKSTPVRVGLNKHAFVCAWANSIYLTFISAAWHLCSRRQVLPATGGMSRNIVGSPRQVAMATEPVEINVSKHRRLILITMLGRLPWLRSRVWVGAERWPKCRSAFVRKHNIRSFRLLFHLIVTGSLDRYEVWFSERLGKQPGVHSTK